MQLHCNRSHGYCDTIGIVLRYIVFRNVIFTQSAYDPKNKLFQKYVHLKGISKWTKMAFFVLWYLFLFQRYSSFPIMQIYSLMTSSVVQVQWRDTKLRIPVPIIKQCYWNLAGMLHPTKYTRGSHFDVAMITRSVPVPCHFKIKYYHLQIHKAKYLVLSKLRRMPVPPSIWSPL